MFTVLQAVPKHYIALSCSVHEHRYLGHSRQTIVFLDAEYIVPHPVVIATAWNEVINGFYCLCQKMTGSASIIYDLRPGCITPQWKTVPYEARYRKRREELTLVLLKALVQQLLEQVAEYLMPAIVNYTVILEQLHYLN